MTLPSIRVILYIYFSSSNHLPLTSRDGDSRGELRRTTGRSEGEDVAPLGRGRPSCFKRHLSIAEFLRAHTLSVRHLCPEFHPSRVVVVQPQRQVSSSTNEGKAAVGHWRSRLPGDKLPHPLHGAREDEDSSINPPNSRACQE